MSHNEYGVARWLGRLEPRSDLPWAIDRLEDERWVEFGRYVSRQEAEAIVTHLVSEGQGDASSFRVTNRPKDLDEARSVLRRIALGLAGVAVLVFGWAAFFRH